MAPIIYNINNAVIKPKMASFDYDWTLVNPIDGKTFASDIDDYEWMYPNIPDKLKQYHKDGYMIVVFTNQSKEWKCQQIQKVMKQLKIPLFIIISMKKEEYKPNIISYNTLEQQNITIKISKDESFFVGDALGRKSDFSDSDKVFAENIGIKCYSPEDVFVDKNKKFELPEIELENTPEIIFFCGYPGSGKSSIAKHICDKNSNYIHIQGDVYKSQPKMIKASLPHIYNKKSIIFDATHSSIKKRNEYVKLAKKFNYKAKCIHITTSLEESYKRNKQRCDKKQVPKIAYSVYKKYYQEPNASEGFTLISI